MNDAVRGRAYELFGSLLLGNRAAVAKARVIAPFDAMLRGRLDAEIAAEHYQMFGLEAFPYAGVFTGDEALIGGAIAEHVSQLSNGADAAQGNDGRSAEQGSESPDHLGFILRRVSALMARSESDRATKLIRECVLPWIIPWGTAVSRQPRSFWSEVVALTLALVGEHCATLEPLEPLEPELASPLVPSDSTSVSEIAAALTVPAVTGALLARQDISGLGRDLELPTGFGPRRLMLTNLLRASADYDRGAELLKALSLFFRAESELYGDVAGSAGLPSACASSWATRATQTAKTLQTMKGQLSSLPPS